MALRLFGYEEGLGLERMHVLSGLTLITLLFYFTERFYANNEHLRIVIVSRQTAVGTTVQWLLEQYTLSNKLEK